MDHQFVASVRWSNRQFARTDEEGTMIHFQKCYYTFQELFDSPCLKKFAHHDKIAFLDIACAPGGFSQYLLDHFPNSFGRGITLPENFGGFPVCVQTPHYHPHNGNSRFQLFYFDLLSMSDPYDSQISVDIVIGDAQYFARNQETKD